MVNVGDIAGRAVQLLLKNRVFWLLGFLVALLSTSINFRSSSGVNPFTFAGNRSAIDQSTINSIVGTTLLTICLTSVLAIVFWVIRIVFEGGLIAAADQEAWGRAPTFTQAWAAARARLGPLLGLNLILVAIGLLAGALVVIAVLIALGSVIGALFSTLGSGLPQPGTAPSNLPDITAASFGGLFLCLCGLVLVAIPAAIVLTSVVQLGERAIMLDNQGVGQAWSTGWRLLRTNFGAVLGWLLMQFAVAVGLIIIAAIVGAIVALPALGLAVSSAGTGDAGRVVLGGMLAIFAWLIGGLIGALPHAWGAIGWTLLYRAITGAVPAGPAGAALYGGPWPGAPGAYGPPAGPNPYAPAPPPQFDAYGRPVPPGPPGGSAPPVQYPGGVPSGPYTGGVYSPPGQYPSSPGPGAPPPGYTVPGQYPGGYAPPGAQSPGYTVPGQYPGGYAPPPAPGGYAPLPPAAPEDRAGPPPDSSQPSEEES